MERSFGGRCGLSEKSISGEIGQQFDFIKVDNVWRFQHPDSEFGADGYPGRIPGQIVNEFEENAGD
ncbi:MAG: hypothetical protein ABEJ47_04370 [Halorhabdus sp.]